MSEIVDTRPASEIIEKHPLLKWYAHFAPWGVRAIGTNLVLPMALSSRFAIGVDDGNDLLLGVLVEDAPHLLSLKWVSASFLRKYHGVPHLVLSHQMDGKGEVRMFIPIAESVASRFDGYKADRLKIRRMKLKNGKPAFANAPQADIPLEMKGFKPLHS